MRHTPNLYETGKDFEATIIAWFKNETKNETDLRTLFDKWKTASDFTWQTINGLMKLTDEYDEKSYLLDIAENIIERLEEIYDITANPIYEELERQELLEEAH